MQRWKILASVYLILGSMQAFGFVDRQIYGEWFGKPGDKLTQAFNTFFILVALSLLAAGLPKLARIRAGACLSLCLVGLFFCSAFWSVDPGISIKQAVEYLALICASIGIATNLEADEYIELLGYLVFGAAAVSLILLVVMPSAVISPGLGDFRGIFSQKNVLGEAMTMGALAVLHMMRTRKKRNLRWLLFLIVIVVAAVESASATSCTTIFVFCAIDFFLFLLRKGRSARVAAISMMILATPVLIASLVFPDALLELMGKDPTLTGRTDIWHLVIADIYKRPLLGWGYLAFWSTSNPAAVDIATTLHWFAPQAHNGLLEILLHVGLVGAALVILIWLRTLFVAVKCMRLADYALGLTSVLSCIGIILVGISESVLVDAFEASTGLFFIAGFFCEKALWSAVTRYSRVPAARREKRAWT